MDQLFVERTEKISELRFSPTLRRQLHNHHLTFYGKVLNEEQTWGNVYSDYVTKRPKSGLSPIMLDIILKPKQLDLLSCFK